MKKITKYILILSLIILTGVFSFGLKVSADGVCMVDGKPTTDPVESCPGVWRVTKNGWCWKDGEIISSIESSSECTAGGQVWQAIGSGVPPPPAGPTPPGSTPPATSTDPLGTCRQGTAGQPVQNITKKDCDEKGEEWIWISYYHFLAPLPCTGNTPGCNGKLQVTFDPTQENNIGAYLNMMITVFIGICSVLAVIMIVIGGIEYMTSELPGNKEHGKHRILSAIFGLVLALASWTILNEINSDLLKADLKTLTQAEVRVMLETEIPADAVMSDDAVAPGTVAPLCPEGIVPTAAGIPACKRIANKFDEMIAAARVANQNISGSGYRSPERQKELRKKYCEGNFTDQSAPCDPPTALPGYSNHNNGLAFDLRCDGQQIRSTDNACFKWLISNASAYGLFNLPSEPWHWSTDGH